MKRFIISGLSISVLITAFAIGFALVGESMDAEAATVECVPPPSGLVGWWPGDGSPNDIAEGNDGVLRNEARFAPGMVGQAFRLNGVSDYVEVSDNENLRLSDGSLSIDAWIFPTEPGGGQFDVIVDKSLDNSNLDYELLLHTDGRLRLDTRNLANSILSPSAIPVNRWTHVAGVQDTALGEVPNTGLDSGGKARRTGRLKAASAGRRKARQLRV